MTERRSDMIKLIRIDVMIICEYRQVPSPITASLYSPIDNAMFFERKRHTFGRVGRFSSKCPTVGALTLDLSL